MNILAIDCASFILSVAVSNGDEIFYEEAKESMKQSELSMDLIDSIVKKAGLKPKDLNGVICSGGPGSFTGLRIGYSIAKGLALSLSIPFASIPTLNLIQKSSHGSQTEGLKEDFILPVIEARKNTYFYSIYKNNQELIQEKEGDCGQIADEIKKYKEKIIITGYSSKHLYDSLPENIKTNIVLNEKKICYAQELVNIAEDNNIFNKDCSENLIIGPEYIRLPDAMM